MRDAVRRYYDDAVDGEWERLERHRVEMAITCRLLARHLPPSAKVLDCGGGPGRYAIWLAEQGHDVTLVDLSPRAVARATKEARKRGLSFRAVEGDAVDLGRFAEAEFDAALLLGPLYHLRELADRERALREAARVLRPGGLLAAAFITRLAYVRYHAKYEPARIGSIYEQLREVIANGKASRDPGGFGGMAYFAHPSEVEPLLASQGFEMLGLYAQEGFAATFDDDLAALDGELWDRWMTLNLEVADDPTLLNGANHVLALARKPLE